MAETQENPAVIAAIAAAYLQQGRAVDLLSRGITLVGCVAIFAGTYTAAPWPITFLAAVIVLLGVAESYFALRVGFDAELFSLLAREAFTPVSFDASMQRLKLSAEDRPGRPMSSRADGAMQLMRHQVLVFGLQIVGILALPIVGIVW